MSTLRPQRRFGPATPTGFAPTAHTGYRQIGRALRRRRRLRAGIVQALCIGAGLALGVTIPQIEFSPDVEAGKVSNLMLTLSGALIALIALVFSLLFLVVPYANTNLTPRLTMFRDDPIVWRAFGFFIGTVVFFSTAGLAVTNHAKVSWLVPAVALVMVVVCLGVVRTLQFRAYQTLQLGATLVAIAGQGERLIGVLYPDVAGSQDGEPSELSGAATDVAWRGELCLLRQVDVPRLFDLAESRGTVIELRVGVGEVLRRDRVLFRVHGATDGLDPRQLLRHVEVGTDRSFDQDPLFALRLLVDIALRALSRAVNDPITAVQSVDAIHALLHDLVGRDLAIGEVTDGDGNLRVVLVVPTWDDYLAIAVDELLAYVHGAPGVRRRIREMVDELLDEAPAHRRAGLLARQEAIARLTG